MKKDNILNNITNFNPFEGPAIERVIHTTQPQAEIWIGCMLGEDDANRAYNESISLILKGDFNKTALKIAISKLVKRHEALRATFSPDGRFMTIYHELPIELNDQDLSSLKITEKNFAIKNYLSEEANYIFDLVKGPLLKISLLKLSEQEHQLVITAHHIICDGWSMGIMLGELGSFYSSHTLDTTYIVPKPESFSLYAEEEERFIESTEYKKTAQYWLKQYEVSVPLVTLPTDFPRPPLRTYKSNRLDFGIDNQLVSDLKKVGVKSGASFVVTLLAAFEVFLYHQTGQDDLVLGLPAAGQSQSGKTQLIGHCVNLLPLRSKHDHSIPFNTYLKNRKNAILDAYEHQQFSFGQLLEKLQIARDLSRVPLVPIVFNIDMGMANDVEFNGLNYKLKSNPRNFESFELSLNATGTEDELILEWSYNSSLFKTSTIEQMMASFKEILYGIVENPSKEIGNFIKVDYSDSLQLNATDAVIFEKTNHLNEEDFRDYSEEKSIVDLFLLQVKRTPNNIAVSFEDKKLTYSELDDLSNQLANYIINSHHIEVDDLVSVMLERSEWIIISALGILKSGAAYVPIEPNYPEIRKNYIIDDSQCKITIDKGFINNFIKEKDKLSSKLNDSIKVLPESRCYIIYTSGTTGNPKGVMIEHRNVVSLLYHGKHLFDFDQDDVWCMFHSFCFDFSVWEMYGALLFGGKLIIVPELIAKDPFEFITMIEKEGVTVLNQTPSAFINLMESATQPGLRLKLRYIIFGGEALFPKHLEKWYNQYPNIKFINMYGITETTVHVTYKEIDKYVIEHNISNIGNAISTLSTYILDEFGKPEPIGVVGELYVAGKGLARGYLNRPELTAEKFVANPFIVGERMYRSGDLAKWLPNGEIEIIGRIDDQVKIRGYRIEIKEIEVALNSLPNIKRSVVVTSNHLAGELSLVAYLQPINKEVDFDTVRNQLAQIMPKFQIPSTFMWVDNFPLTTNGKIDKKNLPSPEYIRQDSSTDLKVPQTELEKDIAKVWIDILQIPVIDIEDNFFEMGGSSLIAQRVIGLLRKKLNTEIPLIKIFQHPTISQLAKSLSENLRVEDEVETITNVLNSKVTASISCLNSQKKHTDADVKKETELIINTTKAQSEILTDCFFGGDDAKRAYNISLSLNFVGKFKYNALEQAVQSLVERHESLRASFSEDLHSMFIYTNFHVDILYNDISSQEEFDKKKSKNYIISDEADFIFDLIDGPLVRFNLIKTGEFEHDLIITVNHAICDGLSTSILLEELGVLYSAFCQDKIPTLNEPDRFSEFADKENRYAKSDEFKRSVEFWLNMYQESIPKLELPIDYPRPKSRNYNNHTIDFLLDNGLLNQLKQIGNSAESNMFTSIVTTLVAAFEVLLCQQTGQNDLVLGLTSSRQANYDMMQMIGHCVNLLPLRSKIDTKISFKDYLIKRKTELFDAYDNQSLSFGQLLEKISIPRDPSRVPLVPVIMNVQLDDVLENENSFFGLIKEIKNNQINYGTFEIELNVSMSVEGPCFSWSYNKTLFKPETIQKMMTSFEEIIKTIVANPDSKIGEILKIDDSEYLKLNNTSSAFSQLPLHELILKQAHHKPSKIALKFKNEEISYGDLEKKVHQMAHYLKTNGVKNGDYVGVSMPRSNEMVIMLIAIMECGAAYLPLDPTYPKQRLEFMLEDSEAKFIIATKSISSTLKSNATQLLLEDMLSDLSNHPDTPLNEKVDIHQAVYILYTSGSTGKPKGVSITHRNLVNLLYSMLHKPGIEENDILISITTISFDIAMAELFGPLLKGAKLVLTDEETAKDTRLLLNLMKEEGITMMQATPATWQMLLYSGWEEKLPIRAISTGEALPIVLAKSIMARVNELWNMYGPTETTIWSAMKQVSMTDEIITIGRPMANTQLYIVDEQNNLVAPGKTGELCIAGDGVAKGYWKRENLTAEKFIENPFHKESGFILYRTGDLAKLLPNGDIHCLGRIDDQIKIRGQRIELGEIEQALDSLDGINSSVVLVHDDLLMAFVISSGKNGDETTQVNNWKATLKEQLPAHMLPHQYFLVEEFPKTLSGKTDRKNLLKNIFTQTKTLGFTEPTTASEKIIANIWQECLKIDKIDANSDFFEIGGHSIVGVQVMARIEKETKNRLPLVALLNHPTIKELAAYMDREFITWDSLVPLKIGGTKPALYIVHGANHNVLMFNALAQRLDKEQPVYGLQSRGLNGVDEPHDSIDQMAADYISEIVASNPDGPYALGGFSYGGIVAYEMARQLLAQGKEVTILAQFDTYVFPSYYHTNPLVRKVLDVSYNIGKMVYLSFNMLSSKKNFIRRKELLKLQISGLILKLKHGKEKQYEMQFNVPYKMHHNHSIATNAYNITPQDIVIDLFRSMEEINFVHDHDLLGWKKMGGRGIRKHMIPGNHLDMFEEPNVEALAASLQNVLDHKNLKSV
ncbi:amino acid adenylation domain-containing protein [Gelidibacter gilvus]|uniref:Non-ribosomal peptide synthetase n=1 Tax=Gelidibacter gilvus TaxID=59602 RepID=A0A4Q0XF63_9FLAO|nr:non-ribosomal peptide synthetase [Gelidibacter gilvus]RXJ49670.1 non-ribosomal peptide synthetase [Gelidibacter gilvus]